MLASAGLGVASLALAAATAGGAPLRAAPAAPRRVPVIVPAGAAAAPFDSPRSLLLPAGWRAEVWARLAGARFAVWAPDGHLLVSVPAAGKVVALAPRADPAAPPRRRVLLSGLSEPEGLGFDRLAGRRVLYVAEPGRLDRYDWGDMRRTVVVRALPDADGLDRLKGLAVGPAHTVYVGVGSDSAVGGPRGVILAVAPDGATRVVARGLHNVEGLAVDTAGRLWLAVNSAGGRPDELAELVAGRVELARRLPPHSAPLGLGVLGDALPPPWRGGLVLALHGALALDSPSRPAVLWFPLRGRGAGVPTVLVSGFQRGAARWGRPSDVLAGPDGALYVVDDAAGAIYRLSPP